METARDALAALNYMQSQDYVTKAGALIIGQSTGGYGMLAAASQNPRGVAGLINFAGGRSGNKMCARNELMAAAEKFGRAARLPMLWIYTENDKLFDPSVSKDLHAAYTSSGAPAKFVLLLPFMENGHTLFHRKEGVSVWAPHVTNFLRDLSRQDK